MAKRVDSIKPKVLLFSNWSIPSFRSKSGSATSFQLKKRKTIKNGHFDFIWFFLIFVQGNNKWSSPWCRGTPHDPLMLPGVENANRQQGASLLLEVSPGETKWVPVADRSPCGGDKSSLFPSSCPSSKTLIHNPSFSHLPTADFYDASPSHVPMQKTLPFSYQTSGLPGLLTSPLDTLAGPSQPGYSHGLHNSPLSDLW